jgi:hypothetical protein
VRFGKAKANILSKAKLIFTKIICDFTLAHCFAELISLVDMEPRRIDTKRPIS